jgi:putative endonuclease
VRDVAQLGLERLPWAQEVAGSNPVVPTILFLMYFVYILQSLRTGGFYVGQCDHLIERFYEHQRGANLATRNRGPWWVPYFEIHSSRSAALRRERQIKSAKSAESIRRIIRTSGLESLTP